MSALRPQGHIGAVVAVRVMKPGAAIRATKKPTYATYQRAAGVVGVQEVSHVEHRHLPCLCSHVRSLIKKMSIKDYSTTHTGLSSRSTGETIEQFELPFWAEKMSGKPVIYRSNARTVLNLKNSKFEEKLLCEGITLNLGDACAFSCGFCDFEGQMTARVSKRIESLHWLQDEGYRTFGMICPSLPQADGRYQRFSDEICKAIRVDHCELVWAGVINLRGRSLVRTVAPLHRADLESEATALSAVMGTGNREAWEQYARATFLAHTENVPAGKLRFLQYVNQDTADWWTGRRGQGAVLLGKIADEKNLTTTAG